MSAYDHDLFEMLAIPEIGGITPARRTDPQTSHDGRRDVAFRAKGQKRLLLAMYVSEDLTDEEAAFKAGLTHVGYWKRCSELRNRGLIEPTGETREGSSGSKQQVCRITMIGQTALEML